MNLQKFICKYCGSIRKSKLSLIRHEKLCESNNSESAIQYRLSNLILLKNASDKSLKNRPSINSYIVKCEKCGESYEVQCTEYRFLNKKYKRFCSRKCSNSRVHSDDTKNKIRNSLKKNVSKKYCIDCGSELWERNKT